MSYTDIGVKESKVLANFRQQGRLLFVISLDDKGGISWGGRVFLRLALYETAHIGNIIFGHVPFAEYLIGDASKIMIWILQWNLSLVGRRADFQWLPPHCPVGVGILIAVCNSTQVVDVWIEIPVASNIVERVILESQINDMLDLFDPFVYRKSKQPSKCKDSSRGLLDHSMGTSIAPTTIYSHFRGADPRSAGYSVQMGEPTRRQSKPLSQHILGDVRIASPW